MVRGPVCTSVGSGWAPCEGLLWGFLIGAGQRIVYIAPPVRKKGFGCGERAFRRVGFIAAVMVASGCDFGVAGG